MRPRLHSHARQLGLTLTELLVAAAIIAFLCLISLPVISSMQSTANGVKCLGNLRNYGSAVLTFATENQGLPWWNGKGFPQSAELPSRRPLFEEWTRPYLHKHFANRLRCPLKKPDSPNYSYEYTGNSALCWYYPKLRDIPAPAHRVVLAMEFGDYNSFYWASPMNTVMWGTPGGEFAGTPPASQIDQSRTVQYHGRKNRRGLHMFFLDGHAALIQPQGGNWRRGQTTTYADNHNDGILYDYNQFRDLKNGTLVVQ